jgi:flavin-dependent dehydrogenase
LTEAASLDRWTWVESAPDGWWYSAVLPRGRLMAAYFTDADLLDAPASRREERFTELLSRTRWTRERVCAARAPVPFQVVSASSTIATPLYGDGWLAVGDAASTIDPLSSQGILYALTSGLNAAAALLAPDRAAALARFAQEITAQLHDDLNIRVRFYQRERRWLDRPYWHRRIGPATLS